jgi:hypothetical protein
MANAGGRSAPSAGQDGDTGSDWSGPGQPRLTVVESQPTLSERACREVPVFAQLSGYGLRADLRLPAAIADRFGWTSMQSCRARMTRAGMR